jgi:hypothetical protein
VLHVRSAAPRSLNLRDGGDYEAAGTSNGKLDQKAIPIAEELTSIMGPAIKSVGSEGSSSIPGLRFASVAKAMLGLCRRLKQQLL